MWTYRGRKYDGLNSRDEVIDYLIGEIVADLSALNTAVDSTVAALADLSAKVAAGDVTAQSDIDAITAKLVAAVQANDPSAAAPVVAPTA